MFAPLNLSELMRRIADGEREAFRQLYLATSPKLFAVAMRIVRNEERSADALQDAFLQIWQKAESYDDRQGEVEAWMTNIVRFRAIDIARRERTRSDYAGKEAGLVMEQVRQQVSKGEGPETNLTLIDCLDAIGTDQRDAILAVHYSGYTGEEYAEHSELPLGTAKSRVRRGIKNLRQCMELKD